MESMKRSIGGQRAIRSEDIKKLNNSSVFRSLTFFSVKDDICYQYVV